MNRKLQSEPYEGLVRQYTDSIAVPRFDRKAIERRSPKPIRATTPAWRQYTFAAVVSVALVAWAAPALPALVADVQSVIQLFLERNGQLVPAADRLVTIDQASKDLPFHVVPPNGVPLASAPAIREISVAGDPSSAQLMVQYPSNMAGPRPGIMALPALTIVETAAASPPSNFFITTHPAGQPPLMKAPRPPGPGEPTPVGAFRIRPLTSSWVTGGTRITLLGTPGAITQAQLDAVRRAMGGQ